MPVCPSCETRLEGSFINCPNCEYPINKKAFFIGHTIITLFIVIAFTLLVSLVYYFTSHQQRKLAMALYALRAIQEAEMKYRSEKGTFAEHIESLEPYRPLKTFLPLFAENQVRIEADRKSFRIRARVQGTDYRCEAGLRQGKPYRNCFKARSSL